MKILVACEMSGRVRDVLLERGHDAWSCDLIPSLSCQTNHIIGDALEVIASDKWDMLIAFPPCTYLCSSGQHWNYRRPGRQQLTEDAIRFFMGMVDADIPQIAIENSVGVMSTRYRKPDQILQPHQFGDDASKQTCLWLKNLPKLSPTRYIEPRIVNGHKRWANQTDSGQNRLGPSDDRHIIRSLTYQGIADAMSKQWTNVVSLSVNLDEAA